MYNNLLNSMHSIPGMDLPTTAAGRPSNWAESRDASFAGRRSRRSSITDDSQLTVENFGGSQDRLHFAGRNPEKELATLANVRKISAPSGESREQQTNYKLQNY